MAIIQSGQPDALLTVDPTAKAARVAPFNSAGVEIRRAQPTPIRGSEIEGTYIAAINGRLTSTNINTWALWMPAQSQRYAEILKLNLLMRFDGTPAAFSAELRMRIREATIAITQPTTEIMGTRMNTGTMPCPNGRVMGLNYQVGTSGAQRPLMMDFRVPLSSNLNDACVRMDFSDFPILIQPGQLFEIGDTGFGGFGVGNCLTGSVIWRER